MMMFMKLKKAISLSLVVFMMFSMFGSTMSVFATETFNTIENDMTVVSQDFVDVGDEVNLSTSVETPVDESIIITQDTEGGETDNTNDGVNDEGYGGTDTPEELGEIEVNSSEELILAIENGYSKICVSEDIEVDTTIYITSSINIYSVYAHTITRAKDFAGDMFVVGEASDGTACEEKIEFTLGNAESLEEDILTIDGNKNNMNVDVTGTVIFVCDNAQVDIYKDVTITNCKKTGNVKSLDDKYTLSQRNYVGGAAAILSGGSLLNIYGGKFTNNEVNIAADATESAYGGVIFSFGELNIYDGKFYNNSAVRGGALYNYRITHIYKAEFKENSASTMGGAVYMPASTECGMYLGSDDIADKVVFEGNISSGAGGAIYVPSFLDARNTEFINNTSTAGNGGAIAAPDKKTDNNTLTLINCTFIGNSAYFSGGAVHQSNGAVSSFENVTFTQNRADAVENSNGNQYGGGAVYMTGSTANLNGVSFNENTSGYQAGAMYINTSCSVDMNNVTFGGNVAEAAAGAVYMTDSADVVMNDVTAYENNGTAGGFIYNDKATLNIYNSEIRENEATTGAGGAVYENGKAVTNAYNTKFVGNKAAGNGGAIYAYSTGTENIIHSCIFDANTSSGNYGGGAIYTSNKCITRIYNVTAKNNNAPKGGFMYITTTGTEVTLNGCTVSGNTASVGGPIIWGNSAGATLYINKSNYSDNDVTGAFDNAYWNTAIYNALTVYDVMFSVPSYKDYGDNGESGDIQDPSDVPVMNVKTAAELEKAISLGFSEICITEDFEVDRTFYIAKNTNIYTNKACVITRAKGFAGDIFVVGKASDGTVCEETVVLTLGDSDSLEEDLLVIDGNKNNMTVDVKGTAVYICNNARADIYKNVTIRNSKKVGNVRTLTEEDELLPKEDVGGAAVNLISGTLNIYGAKFKNNEANIASDVTTSAYGGAIFSFGELNIYDGVFNGNSAVRGGALYNYRMTHIYKGEFKNNSASTMGGAVYMPSSTLCGLYIGNEIEENRVVFEGNTSVTYGGAIYVQAQFDTKNAIFKNNECIDGYGGAISAYGNGYTLNLEKTLFDGNKASQNGGAVHQRGSSISYMKDVEFYRNINKANETTTGTRYGGGALYIAGSSSVNINGATFADNESDVGGAAISLVNSSSAVMNDITATGNKSQLGGFAYNDKATLNIYNSEIRENEATTGAGGAIYETGTAVTNVYNTKFVGNKAAGNGGAIYAYSTGTENIIHSCIFDTNTSSGNYGGGAIYTSNKCITRIYNVTAKNNNAPKGGFMYITTTGTEVTLNGCTVSGNTASVGGPIIWGNSAGATLYINKNNYTDSNVNGELDNAYWSSAVYNKLTVSEINDNIPQYDDPFNENYDEYTDSVDVKSAAELEKAINDGIKNIRITRNFAVDRTFYITRETVIFTTDKKTIKRASDFGGDIFVVGEDANGNTSVELGTTAKLTLGNEYSETADLLIIDGNKDNMAVDVTGTVLFLGSSGQIDLYKNVSIVNNHKVGNERTLELLNGNPNENKYKFTSPSRIGGAALIISSGTVNIYGATIKNNSVNEEFTGEGYTEEDRNSTLGGAVYNNGTLKVYSGLIEANDGARGGFIYNMRDFYIYGGQFVKNHATSYGGAIYLASSQFSQLNMSNPDGADTVLFKENYAEKNAGALYCAAMAIAIMDGNITFEGNKTLNGNGAAICNYGMINANNVVFKNNYSYGMGGAVYIANSTDDLTTRIVTLKNSTFENNIGRNGGAIAIYASSDELSEGGKVEIDNCNFISNKAVNTKETEVTSNVFGGAIYITRKSLLSINNSSFKKNEALFEGGAIYTAGQSETTISNTTFENNKTTSESDGKGGAISLHSASVACDAVGFTQNTTLKNGGALYVSYTSLLPVNSDIDIVNSSFNSNRAGNAGGAVYATKHIVETAEDEILNIKNTTFNENSAVTGGGVYLTAGADAYMSKVEFNKNTATTSKGYAGAIYLANATVAEIDDAKFTENSSEYRGGAVVLSPMSRAIMNKVVAKGNFATADAGFLQSNSARLDMYESSITENMAGVNGGAFTIYNEAVTNVNNTVFEDNSANGNGGAVYAYTNETESLFNTCIFNNNTSNKFGGAFYVSNNAILNAYKTVAKNNSANVGGFMYETVAGTTVTINDLTVKGNSASSEGPIIYGNNDNAVLNIHKINYIDEDRDDTADDSYWYYAIANKLMVNDLSGTDDEMPTADTYESRFEENETDKEKPVVPVSDVLDLGINSSDNYINSTYEKLPRLDNSSNFMSRKTSVFENINGEDVSVDVFVSSVNDPANICTVGEGLLIYQSILYKQAHPEEDVNISVASFRFSSLAAVNINRNSRYFGYMRNLAGANYDRYGFVRISYLLITAAKMGINVTVVGQLDGYPHPASEPTFDEYMESYMDYPCDPDYVTDGKVRDYLNFKRCQWTSYEDKAATDMMHTKLCAVSHYLDMNGVAHKNAIWSSSTNLDGVSSSALNGNNKMQTATIVSDHEQIYRAAYNYIEIVSQYCGQEDVYLFRTKVSDMSKKQIDLLEAGKGNEIPANEQIVYIGTETDDVFEFYFSPFGGDVMSWSESYNPYCKYLRKFSNSDDYVELIWNSAFYDKTTPIVVQIEDMIHNTFVNKKNPNNVLYTNLEDFDKSVYKDFVIGKDIGYMSLNELKLGALHSKDLQISYSENGKREYVSILSSVNMHGGAMSYQSNFLLVIKEDTCNEDSVYFNLADHTSVGIVEHTYGEELRYIPNVDNVDGYTYKRCKYCNKEQVLNVIHRPGEWIAVKEATPYENGVSYQECRNCGKLLGTKEVVGKTTTITENNGKVFSQDSVVTIPVNVAPHTFEAVINVPKTINERVGVIAGNFKEGMTTDVISFEIYTKGRPRLFYQKDGGVESCTFSYDIRSSKKKHIAITVVENTAILYVDGKAVETKALTLSLPDFAPGLSVGGDNREANSQYFKGTIYSVTLFDDSRTADEIKADCIFVDSTDDAILYTYTPDNEVVDEFVNEYVSSAPSGAMFTVEKAYAIKTLSSTPRTFEATISVPTDLNDRGGVIVSNYNGGTEQQLAMEIHNNGRPRLFAITDNQQRIDCIFNTDIRSDEYKHIVITISGNTAVLYVDGNKAETQTFNYSFPQTTANFKIGGDDRNGNLQYFKGKIRSVALYSDERTAEEIKLDSLLNVADTDNLLYSGYYVQELDKFTEINGRQFSEEEIKGIKDIKATPYTIESVINVPKDMQDRAGVIVGNYEVNSANVISFEVHEQGKLRLYWRNASRIYTHIFNTDVRSDNPQHVVLTVDGTLATIYLNGVAVETATLAALLPTVSTELKVGGDNRTGNAQYFKGTIYSVALYSDVKSAEEISSISRVSDKNCVYNSVFVTKEKQNNGNIKGKTFSHSVGSQIPLNIKAVPLTFEALINVPEDVDDRAGVIVGNYSLVNKNVVSFEVYSEGKVRIYHHTGSKADHCIFNTDIRSDRLVHIAVTIDGNEAKLYVDGNYKETQTMKYLMPTTLDSLKIGGDNRIGNTQYFKGTIGTVALFSDVRTAEEIMADVESISNKEDNLLCNLDYTNGMCNNSQMGGAHNLSDWIVVREPSETLHGIMHQKCLYCGTAIVVKEYTDDNFDGDYVDYSKGQIGLSLKSNDDAYILEQDLLSVPKTIEARFLLKKSCNERAGVLVGNYDNSTSEQLNLEIYTNGKPRLYYKTNNKAYTYLFNTDVRSDYGSHLTITIDGLKATLYLNGVEKETVNLSVELANAKENFVVGSDNRQVNPQYFKGTIYSVAMFDDVRTAQEIGIDMIMVPSTSEGLLFSKYFVE